MDSIIGLLGCAVDLDRGVVLRGGGTIPLTTRELDLLRYFVARPACIIDREELLREVWQLAPSAVTRACDGVVRRLRQKIELQPDRPDHLLTVHGTGYRFQPFQPPPAPAGPSPASRELHLGDRVVDFGRLLVLRDDGQQSALSSQEAALLERLVAAQGAMIERAALSREICGQRVGRALDTLVWRVRAKIEADPRQPVFLVRAHGGYRLALPQAGRVAPSALFGREDELAEILAALEGPGIVALVGPAGVGKTALARQIASRASAAWIDASGAASIDDLVRSAERALGVAPLNAPQLARVGQSIAHEGPRVVVVDEVELLVPAVADALQAWRRIAPDTTFLVTSRVRLRCDRVVEVGPLGVDAAVDLFLDRARPSGLLGDLVTREAVARLVERFDRLPLAIELSARRLGVLSVEAQAHTPTLELLADGFATGRHASVRDALAEAWALLDDRLRDRLLTVGCFRRFTVEDLERVAPSALEEVQALRDRSWIARLGVANGQLELGLLEVVRAFVDEVRASDLADTERWRRHVRALAALGEPSELDRIGQELGPEDLARLRRLVPELLRAAEVARSLGDLVGAARCAEAVATIFHREGRFDEAIAAVELVRPLLEPGLARARLDYVVAIGHRSQTRRGEALAAAIDARAHASLADELTLEARARGIVAELTPDPEEAVRAAELAARAGNAFLVEWARYLAEVASGVADPVPALERAAAVAARTGSVAGADRALFEMGRYEYGQGRLHLAAARWELAARRMGEGRTALLWLRTSVLAFMSRAQLGDDDFEARAAELRSACRRAVLPTLEVNVLLGLAFGWLARGRPDRARAVCLEALNDPRLASDHPWWGPLHLRRVLADAELELGRPERAIAVAAEVGSVDRDTEPMCSAQIEALRALSEARLGQHDLALSRFAAAEKDFTTPETRFFAHIALAHIHLAAKRTAAAVAAREDAARLAVSEGLVGVLARRRDLEKLDQQLALLA